MVAGYGIASSELSCNCGTALPTPGAKLGSFCKNAANFLEFSGGASASDPGAALVAVERDQAP